MNGLQETHPAATVLWFAATAGIAMFCMDPVILALSLVGSVTLYLVRNGSAGWRSHFAFLLLLLGMTLVNPLFSHRGETVLFVLNDNPVTAEALIYGATAAVAVLSVIYWFRSFTQIMTSEKLLWLFGVFSPKFALVLSMTLRYIPLFGAQAKKIHAARKAMGTDREESLSDPFRNGVKEFSVLLTWGLENGIITANSMAARGYGSGKRTQFSRFRFRGTDIAFTVLTVVLCALTCVGIVSGVLTPTFYPCFSLPSTESPAILSRIAYGVLAFFPSITEEKEKIKWKYLKSKI